MRAIERYVFQPSENTFDDVRFGQSQTSKLIRLEVSLSSECSRKTSDIWLRGKSHLF